jgi:capsule polysaccharide export protein KpsE/RkpR
MLPNENEFNLTGVVHAWRRRWKTIILFVALSLAVSTIVLYFLPKQYEARAVATAGNPLLSDKAYLFNQNIDQLYSNFGNADDLDRLLGVATLDTTFKIIVDSFKLVNYYQSSGTNNSVRRYHAVSELKEDVAIRKNELNQLTVEVWNKDPLLAANIANSVLARVEDITAAGLQSSYAQTILVMDTTLVGLKKKYEALSANTAQPETNIGLKEGQKTTLLKQLEQYQTTYDEVRIAAANRQPALIILQPATPPAKAGKPKIFAWLFVVMVASVGFGLLAVLLYDRKPF